METKHPAKSHSFWWVQQTDLCFRTRGTGSLPEIKFCRDTHGKRIRLGSGRFGQARLGDDYVFYLPCRRSFLMRRMHDIADPLLQSLSLLPSKCHLYINPARSCGK